MDNFEIVIFLMIILIALSSVADKIKLPYPILLVFAGLIIGFMPTLPDLELDPDIVFLVFLPPLLYDAAVKTSWLDFKKEIRTISTLAITLVFFTTTIVAVTAHYLVPGFTWPLAFVLGAVISPPDAVAATSIIKGLGLNRKVVTIIEGESLVNDASALIAYRYAVAAVGGTFVLWKAGVEFLIVAGGGVLIGLFIGALMSFAHKQVKDNANVETSLSLLTPFVAYLLAEHFKTSGVLAVVSAGLFISWRSREIFSSQTRLQTKSVWETSIFLLNGIVFLLIGLQLPGIVKDLSSHTLTELIGYGLVISAVTIIIRIIWVFSGAYHQSIFKRKPKPGDNDNTEPTSWKNVLIVAWTGTRGVVSLATALAIPLKLADGSAFPKRHSILLLAFVVILVTLVIQGLTLPILIRLLKIKPVPGSQRQEERELQLALSENILQYVNHDFPVELDEKALNQVRKQYELTISLLTKKNTRNKAELLTSSSQFSLISQTLAAQTEIINYERELLTRFHREGTFSDEAIRKAEQELDIEELRLLAIMEKRSIE